MLSLKIKFKSFCKTVWSAKRKRAIFFIFLILIITLPIYFYLTSNKVAAWFDDNWHFRKSIEITNNVAEETNVYVTLTLDTSDTTKFQTDCGDLRFTKYNGELMPYYIVSGCGTNSTVVHVNFDTFPSGKQTIFEYYGNPMAPNGFLTSDFSTAASNYTVGSTGSEEKSVAPVAYWTFDEGQGTTAHDESVFRNDGTLGTGSSAPSWKPESECVSGKCLSFDGNDYAATSDKSFITTTNSAHSVFAWVKPTVNNTRQVILNYGETHDNNYASALVINSDGKLVYSTNGSGTGYDLVSGFTVPTNTWSFVGFSHDATTGVSIYMNGQVYSGTRSGGTVGLSPFVIGAGYTNSTRGSYFKGSIDESKIYDYTRTAAQIKADYNAGLSGMGKAKAGASAAFGGKSDKWMTDGLVGYWKMDESSGTAVQDYSGNNNNGTSTNMLEAGTAAISSDTLNIIPSSTAPFSATDDAYNNMIVYITGGTGCSVSTGTQRIISDYTGSTGTIIVSSAFSTEADNCTYEIRHQVGGKFGNGIQFEGRDDRINAGTSPALQPSQITVAFWTKRTGSWNGGNNMFIWTKTTNWQGTGWYLGSYDVSSSNEGVFMCVDSRGTFRVDQKPDTLFPLNEWTHVVATFDSSSKKYAFYINGVSQTVKSGVGLGVLTDPISITSNSYTKYIGYEPQNQIALKGQMDETRIYNRVLSPDEIQKLYNWAPGPVGHWKMDEKVSGDAKTILDNSGNGNNGTTYYGSNTTGMDCTRPGKYGTACEFDGTDDRIIAGTASSLDINSNLTLEAWVKPSALSKSGGGEIISKDADAYFYRMAFNDGGTVSFRAFGTSDATLASSSVLAVNSWNHIAMVYDGATKKIFLNGKLDASEATTGLMSNAAGRIFYMGGYGNSNENFPGAIDDVRIYNYARSQSQIIEDMTGGSHDPLAYYKFDEGYGSTTHNEGIGGTALNGTLGTGSSAPIWSNDGKYGKALSFDGSDYVDAGTSPAFNDLQSLSVSVWVYPTADGTSNGRDIIQKNYSTSNPYATWAIERSNDNKFKFTVDDGGYNPKYSANVFGNNQWYFVTMVITPTTVTGYVNGIQEVTFSRTTTMRYDATKKVIIGTWGSGLGDSTQFWIGKIDEPKIYNFALNPDDIKNDFEHSASAQMGSSGSTSGTGAPTNSAGGEYCVPGDTTSCAGPIAEWKMDEKTGTTAYDTSGNGKDGSLGTGSSAPTWTNGKYGSGLNFDGANDKITISEITTTDISVSAWVYPTNCGSGRWCAIVNSSTGITRYPAIRDGKFFVYDGDSNFGSINVPNNTWTHVALTFVGSTKALKTYVNGVLDLNRTGTQYSNAVINKIGIFDTSDFPFSGKMDQIRVYNYVRTPAQIAWEYNGGKPIAEWRMNECQGGTIHDESGNGNNGTITLGSTGSQTTTLGNGTCLTAGTTPWYGGRVGKYGASLNLDGTDDYVNIGNSTLFQSFNAITFSAWVNFTAKGSFDCIVWKGSAAVDQGFLMYLDGSGLLRFGVGTGSATLTPVLDSEPAIGEWHHIVGVYDGSTVGIYIDGVYKKSIAKTGTISESSNNLVLGDSSQLGYPFNGKLDDVKIFNYALTAEQIKTLYNANSAVNFGN